MYTTRLFFVACLIVVSGVANAATYYVDSTNGVNGASGDKSAPWATVSYAIKNVAPGDTINLLPGEYGSVDFTAWGGKLGTSWDAPITVQNDPDSPPHSAKFTSIGFGQSYNMYYKLIGFAFIDSDVTTAVYGINTSNVHMYDFLIRGAADGSTGPSAFGLQYRDADDIVVEGFEIYNIACMGIELGGCTNSAVRGNYVHDIASSAIRGAGLDGTMAGTVFEYNRVENQRPEMDPGVHGSGLSMRCSDVVVRGTIIRNFGNSRAIFWYAEVAPDTGYENILFENNLLYDTYAWAAEFVDMGANCVFRNNTFIGGAKIRFAPAVDGTGLHIYNNVSTGLFYVNNEGDSATLLSQTFEEASARLPNVNTGGNVFETLAVSCNPYYQRVDGFRPNDGNIIAINSANEYNPGFDANSFAVGNFFATVTGDYPYLLTATAAAVDAGLPTQNPGTDLRQGSRDAAPDAGAYEYSSIIGPTADAGTDITLDDSDNDGFADVALNGSSSSDIDGTIVSYVWTENGVQIATGATATATFAVGSHLVVLTVTDNDDATGSDSVAVTINGNAAPIANAGADQAVVDADLNGSEDITLDASGSSDADGTIVSYVWTEAAAQIATGVSPTITFAIGMHTVDLTVTDDIGATGVDSVIATVSVPGSFAMDDFDSQTFNAPFTYDDGTTVPVWSFGSDELVEYEPGDYALRESGGVSWQTLAIGGYTTWSDGGRVTLPEGVSVFQFTVINNDPSLTKPAQSGRTLQMYWQAADDGFDGHRGATITFDIAELAPGESTTVSIPMSDFVQDDDVFGSEGNTRWGGLVMNSLLADADAASPNVLFDEFAFIAGAPAAKPGDADGDDDVDLDDFVILKTNFGATVATVAEGDFDGDGDVDLNDFVILKTNFGK